MPHGRPRAQRRRRRRPPAAAGAPPPGGRFFARCDLRGCAPGPILGAASIKMNYLILNLVIFNGTLSEIIYDLLRAARAPASPEPPARPAYSLQPRLFTPSPAESPPGGCGESPRPNKAVVASRLVEIPARSHRGY